MSMEKIKSYWFPTHYRDDISRKLDEKYDSFSYCRKSNPFYSGSLATGKKDWDLCLNHVFFLGKMTGHASGMSLEESIIYFIKETDPVVSSRKVYTELVKKGYLRMEEEGGKKVYFPTEEACKLADLFAKN